MAALCDRAGHRSRPTSLLPYTLVTVKFTLRRVPKKSADERQRMGAPQLPRRCLGDRSRLEHNYVAGPDIDLGNHLVGHLMLDAAPLDRVLPGVRLHGDGERLPRVSGVQPHRHGTAWPDSGNAR